ncbi:MAG TPA: ATP-grasp domain-containing protein [Patescibacteria group bacterium]|nr:ATP-grasp domain-containing protein [Patescibacteria group bacterium]
MLEPILNKNPLAYVTRDIERALGLPPDTKGYFIISNFTPFVKSICKGRTNVLLIKGTALLATHELLNHPKTKSFLNKLNDPQILVFKNTSTIEKICQTSHWRLLNPPSDLASLVEEKISQVKWLGPLKKLLPPHEIKTVEKITWPKFAQQGKALRPFILQFNRAHTGSGTYLIQSESELNELKQKFPQRLARLTQYISGPMFTNNNIVWGNKILVGNINYQITGLKPFTNNPFATIGNDWALPPKILTKKQIRDYEKIANDVGKRLEKNGWAGLFGIDVILNPENNQLYLIEINARQPASTTFESVLQNVNRVKTKNNRLTTFEAHVLSLLKEKNRNNKLVKINNGAQIIQKVVKKMPRFDKIEEKIKKLKFKYFSYSNTKPESDWLRLQSPNGLLTNQQKLNSLGQKIKTVLNEPL